jgi:hypothetical protein
LAAAAAALASGAASARAQAGGPTELTVAPSSLTLVTETNLNPTTRTLTLTNPGATETIFAAFVDVGWMRVAPNAGGLGSDASIDLDLAFDVAGLTADDYSGTVSIFDGSAVNDPAVVDVALQVLDPVVETILADLDFTIAATTSDWLFGTNMGVGASTQGANGICMQVPDPGDNILLWISPSNLIPLMDSTVYRARMSLDTDQTDVDAIPLFNFIYDNFQLGGRFGFMNYGGERWIWDANGHGGAMGIGRPQGRSDFEFWFAPISLALPQWRLFNEHGSAAFDPEADAFNDMRLIFRVLDLGGAADPLAASRDSGTICIRSARISAVPLDALRRHAVTVYDPPLNDGSNVPGQEDPDSPDRTHFPQSDGNAANFPNVVADIIDGEWRVSMGPLPLQAAAIARATLGPDVIAAGPMLMPDGVLNPLRFFPIEWSGDALYMTRARVRSDLPGPDEGVDPVDVIILNHETFTAELGGLDWVTGGADINGDAPGDGGGMLRAGSPRLRSTTGGVAPEYLAFFHGNNATLSPISFADRWKAQVDIFNRSDLNGNNSGMDSLAVESLAVDRIDNLNPSGGNE